MKNTTLIKLAKDLMLSLIEQCTEPQQMLFKRMYCHHNLEATIKEAVDQMDPMKIDWAITQTEATIIKNNSKLEEKYNGI